MTKPDPASFAELTECRRSLAKVGEVVDTIIPRDKGQQNRKEALLLLLRASSDLVVDLLEHVRE